MKLRVTFGQVGLITLLVASATPAFAQSFRVQCPTSTITHPVNPANTSWPADYNSETPYTGPTALTPPHPSPETPVAIWRRLQRRT